MKIKNVINIFAAASMLIACNCDCEELQQVEVNSSLEKVNDSIDKIQKPCVESNSTQITPFYRDSTAGHRIYSNNIIVAFHNPITWVLSNSESDTLIFEIQLPANKGIDRIEKSDIVSGNNCNNDLMVFNIITKQSSTRSTKYTDIVKHYISYQEWKDLEYFSIKVDGVRKKVLAANENVQPDE